MPVVTNQGLVGRVDAVIADASRVQLITDPASSINVYLQNAETDAILIGSVTGDLSLDMISQDASVEPGDLILTSGLGGGYPSDLIVGQVATMRSLEYELFQQATVQPAADFSRLDIVLVITNFRPVDIAPLVPYFPCKISVDMRNIVAFPLLLPAVIFQSAVVSQVQLLSGYADLLLLVLGAWALQKRVKSVWLWAALGCAMLAFVSNMPRPVIFIGYFSSSCRHKPGKNGCGRPLYWQCLVLFSSVHSSCTCCLLLFCAFWAHHLYSQM